MRLRRPAEFQEVLRRGKRTGDSLLMMAALRSETHNCRMGLAVSKRVGGSVIRNKVKRRLREAFREFEISPEGHWTRSEGWDIVVSARPAAAEANFQELRASLLKLAERLKVAQAR